MSALPADTRLAKYCRRAGAGVRNNMALKLRPTGLGSGIVFGKPADMRADGHAATLDEAEAQLEAAWRQWLAWAKLREGT